VPKFESRGFGKRLKQIPAVRWVAKQSIYGADMLFVGLKRQRIQDSIVITGTPRSGTTLVMELVAWLPGYTAIFEPFHPVWFAGAREMGLERKPFAPADADWPEMERYLDEVLTGRAIGKLLYFNTQPDYVLHRLRSRKLVAKFVRANQLMPWMTGRFDVRGRIFVIRHPSAVVSSQFQSGFTGYLRDGRDHQPTQGDLIAEATVLEPHFPGTLDRVRNLAQPEEILAAIWCLDMLVPLSSPRLDTWYLLPYERLIKDQESELTRLFSWLGEEVPEKAKSQLTRPTRVARDADLKQVTDSSQQLPKWKKTLGEDQVRRILTVVDRFGFDFYGENPEPDYRRLQAYLERVRSEA
jgi:hypothetical protein